MKPQLRLIALVLVLALLLSPLAACSETGKDEPSAAQETAAAGGDAVPGSEEAAAEDGEIHYYEAVPTVDYDGWTLNIANDGISTDWFSGFTSEELTGDVFFDDLYNRQIAVQERYNITLEEINNGSVNMIKSCVTSGSGDVGFGYVIARSCMGLISQNYILPITSLPAIDMTKPYWDQGAQKTLKLFGKMFYGYIDISWDHYESMAVLFYNGFLLTDNGINTTPYDLTREGKWTLDAMYDMMQKVVKDADGDGQMKMGKDIFGFCGRDFEYLPSLYSSNLRLIRYDEEQETYVMDVTQDAVMAVGEKIGKIINDKMLSISGGNDDTRKLFKDGKCLFYSRLLGDFRNLRDKEDDYGVVAFPSLEENTEGMVYVQNPYAILVPCDCSDTERIGTLLEALGAYTYDYILDDYVSKTVIGKGVRDRESAELLRYYMTVRAFDLCYAFDNKTPISAYSVGVVNGNYASAQKRNEKLFQKNNEKTLKALRGD